MAEANEALMAVEALCDLLAEMVETEGIGSPQIYMFSYRLKQLKAGCVALREGFRTGPAADILSRKDKR